MEPKTKALVKLANQLVLLSVLVLVLGAASLFVPFGEETKEDPFQYGWCGTPSLPEYQASSKKVYKTNCKACHAYERQSVAISMKDAKEKNSATWFWNFAMNEQAMIDQRDSATLAVNAADHKMANWNHNFGLYVDSIELWEFIQLIE